MTKLIFSQKFPFVRFDESAHRARLREMQRDIDGLRERLQAAQGAKSAATKQADELRKEKDRIRQSLSQQKKTNDELQRINDRLGAKISDMQRELEEERFKRTKRSKHL